MMRIGIDCTVTARPFTGFETYVSCLASALVRLESDSEIVVFAPRPLPHCFASLRGRVKIVTSPFGTQVLAHQAWLASMVPIHRMDVMHYPAFPPLLPPRRFVMTVHDATPWKFAETMPARTRVYFRSTLGLWMRRSKLIIAPSLASKDEIARRFGIPENRVRVVYPGVRNSLRPINGGELRPGESVILSQALRADSPYVLFVGTVEPRKNLPLAIRAIAKLRAEGWPCRLVVAGRIAWGIEEVEKVLEEERVRDAVGLVGYVSDQELALLYKRAACLVQPSLHEGFGSPVAEAMALGCPVVASRIPPHIEVLGDAGLYISPHDVGSLAAALSQILGDHGLRASMAARALERAGEFTWRRTAERTLEAYRDAIRA